MQACPECSTQNPADVQYCESCGTWLGADPSPLETIILRSAVEEVESSGERGTDIFPEAGRLLLEIDGESHILPIAQKYSLGRTDMPYNKVETAVDLTPFDGYAKGVSRHHAQIHLKNHHLDLVDLGSANGTFLFGQPLMPLQHYRLHDGDEIRLAEVIIYLHVVAPSDEENR